MVSRIIFFYSIWNGSKGNSSGDFTWDLNWETGKYIDSNILMSEIIEDKMAEE